MNFQNRINAVAQDVLAFRYANEGFKALRNTQCIISPFMMSMKIILSAIKSFNSDVSHID